MLTRSILGLLLLLTCCRDNDEMTVVFGGDVMLDRGIRAQIKQQGLPTLLDDIAPVFHNADFAVINLECPVTTVNTPLTKKFVFRADPASLPALREAGITHGNLANNHSYDHGRTELIATAQNLRDAHLVPTGYGATQRDACAPVLLEKEGTTLAIFASTPLLLESWMYLENEPGMCQATIDDLKQAVAAYRNEHPQTTIVVTLHWGVEYQRMPTAIQRTQARQLVEAGADAIIGHHPHVVQRFETIHGKPVFYSLGNLIFDNPNPLTHEGILVALTVKAGIVNTEIIPYKAQQGKPVRLNSEEKETWFKKFQEISDPLPD